MGMTAEQYWDQDCSLARFYREAHNLNIQQQNYMAWLQGKYVYDALAALFPLFNSNVKRGVKPKAYVKPYDLGLDTKEQLVDKNKKKMNDGKAFMEMFMTQTNKKFKEKEARDHG